MRHQRALWLVALAAIFVFASCKSDDGGSTDSGFDAVDLDGDSDGSDSGDDAGDDSGDDAGDDTGGDTADVPDIDPNTLLAVGELCLDDPECRSSLCFQIDANVEQGFCSSLCADDEGCPDEFDCVFLLNSEGDAARVCVPTDLCIDTDDDEYGIGPGCRGPDCDDTNELVNGGADEVCDALDNDCDGNVDDNPIDANIECDTGLPGLCSSGRAFCFDGSVVCEQVRPSTEEFCDNIDNDCDGLTDEDGSGNPLSLTCYNGPAATLGIGGCTAGVRTCVDGQFSLCEGQVIPQLELCDGVDNDCNGLVDDDAIGSGLCDTGQIGVCAVGTTSCDEGSDECIPRFNPSPEICDNLDNDCDGIFDESNDPDQEDAPLIEDCYSGPPGTRDVGVCIGGLRECSAGTFGTCAGEVIPSTEICNLVDDNCDGVVDDGNPGGGIDCVVQSAFGECRQGQTACNAGRITCASLIQPGEQEEICDGIDNDCDGLVDEWDGPGADPGWDNLGDVCIAGLGICSQAGVLVCDPAAPLGAPICSASAAEPQTEVCDGQDNDCDGEVDEDPTWADLGEGCIVGQGVCAAAGIQVCNRNDTAGATVCSATARTGSAEICDGLDNDCNGLPDDGFDIGLVCNVGVGICARSGVTVCTSDAQGTECNAAPGQSQNEICDGLDNDCDGTTDEGFNVGAPCSAGLGECAAQGVFQCDGPGATACNAVVGSSSTEICDGLDNDCDGTTDEGFNVGAPCSAGLGECATQGVFACDGPGATSCNANPPSGVSEVCDGLDNDCDGTTDEGFNVGRPCSAGLGECATQGVFACDGLNATACDATPPSGSTEICDGLDNDCDGTADETFNVGAPCSAGLGECAAQGVFRCDGPGATACNAVVGSSSPEICDGLDNDCDGTADETFNVGAPCSAGLGVCATQGVFACDGPGATACNANPPSGTSEICDGLDNDCDGVADEGFNVGAPCSAGLGVCAAQGVFACDGPGATACNAVVGSASTEVCDGLDNDCDGTADETFNVGRPCSAGLGECATQGVFACNGLNATACDANPPSGSAELCDGLDNDCDGVADEGFNVGAPCSAGLGVCAAQGVFTCDGLNSTSCNAVVGSSSAEVCDGLDNDCDGITDEGFNVGAPCSAGLGVCAAQGVFACDGLNSTSCNAVVGSSSAEVCDGLDNDCDGTSDENFNVGAPCSAGLGECATQGVFSCDGLNSTSCNANPPSGSTELCDGLDNDCDGLSDEDFSIGGPCSSGLGVCATQGIFACNGLNSVACNANPPSGSSELCDGLDNDCDGQTDENFAVNQPCSVGVGLCARPGVNECNGSGNAVVCVGTPGPQAPEVCDGQDNDCDGVIDDGFVDGSGNYTTNTACGACSIDCTDIFDNPNAQGVCDNGGSSPECEMVCDSLFYNLNNIPQDGCEFFHDQTGVYVSQESGSDSGACGLGPLAIGGANYPCATIGRGLARASQLGRDKVFVADGAYDERVVLRNGIDLLGAYNPVSWSRNVAGTLTAIRSATTGGDEKTLYAEDITSQTLVEGFLIYGAPAVGGASNSYAVYILDSTGALELRDNLIYGAPGAPGTVGVSGQGGTNGDDGKAGKPVKNINCSTGTGTSQNDGGNGGSRTCQDPATFPANVPDTFTNVNGGDGGFAICPDRDRQEGSGDDGQNNGGDGGPGGWGHSSSTGGSCSPTGGQPETGTPGDPAPSDALNRDGGGGNGCSDGTGQIVGTEWRGFGGSTANDGQHGRGGGGGGAGGGQRLNGGNNRDIGGSGGGGGSGGCAGEGGYGGTAGGGSFGVFILFDNRNATSGSGLPRLVDNKITRAQGGSGGTGGLGGGGGDSGLPGAGGILGSSNTYDGPIYCIFPGAVGGSGSRGGHGGGGGGGCGGASYDVFAWDTNGVSQSYSSQNTFPLAGASTGGGGGSGGSSLNPSNTGEAGDSGDSGTVFVMP